MRIEEKVGNFDARPCSAIVEACDWTTTVLRIYRHGLCFASLSHSFRSLDPIMNLLRRRLLATLPIWVKLWPTSLCNDSQGELDIEPDRWTKRMAGSGMHPTGVNPHRRCGRCEGSSQCRPVVLGDMEGCPPLWIFNWYVLHEHPLFALFPPTVGIPRGV